MISQKLPLIMQSRIEKGCRAGSLFQYKDIMLYQTLCTSILLNGIAIPLASNASFIF